MSKFYTLEEVKSIRDKISELGERSFPLFEAEREKIIAERKRTGEEWSKIRAKWSKIKVEHSKAEAEWDIKLFDILIQICPEAHYRNYGNWIGYLVIPESKDRDWVIPLFTGDYDEMKHKAFSIWTMPRGSCDEKLAKEVKDE